jgi:hypothetical protein
LCSIMVNMREFLAAIKRTACEFGPSTSN